MDSVARVFFPHCDGSCTSNNHTIYVPKINVAQLVSVSICGASVTKCHDLLVILCVYACK